MSPPSEFVTQMLVRFSRLVAGTLDAGEVLRRLVEVVCEHLGAEAAAVYRIVEATEAKLVAQQNLDEALVGSVYEVDALSDHIREAFAAQLSEGAESITVMLVSNGRLFGALAACYAPHDPCEPLTRQLVEAVADIAAVALDNAYQHQELERSYGELRELSDTLARTHALRVLGQMASVVAHEVKNPLAAIRGVIQVIEGRLPSESRDRPVLRDVIARLDHLNVMVQDVLQFARPRTPNKVRVDLRDLVVGTASLMRNDRSYERVVFDIEGEPVEVPIDPDMFKEVLVNLFGNAAQAMGSEGVINVRVRRDNGVAKLVVADHGPGIDRDIAGEIFEPFFTTRSDGNGLGLAIVRQLVEAHGGSIRLANGDVRREGACFEIQLPVHGGHVGR